MNAAAQATLMHAAELLETQASKLFEHQNNHQRIVGHKTRVDTLATALELRLLAKRINDGQIGVPPAPYVASKVEQQVLGKALFRSAKIPAPTLTKGE